MTSMTAPPPAFAIATARRGGRLLKGAVSAAVAVTLSAAPTGGPPSPASVNFLTIHVEARGACSNTGPGSSSQPCGAAISRRLRRRPPPVTQLQVGPGVYREQVTAVSGATYHA